MLPRILLLVAACLTIFHFAQAQSSEVKPGSIDSTAQADASALTAYASLLEAQTPPAPAKAQKSTSTATARPASSPRAVCGPQGCKVPSSSQSDQPKAKQATRKVYYYPTRGRWWGRWR